MSLHDRIFHLMRAVEIAEQHVVEELALLHPTGSTINVLLQTNHKTPSAVTVIDYEGGRHGMIRVQCTSGHRTTVSVRQVVR